MATPPPPQGPPWDAPLSEATLAFVDLEMTGLDPTRDRVIEICIERVRGEAVVGRLHTLVRPESLAVVAGAPSPREGTGETDAATPNTGTSDAAALGNAGTSDAAALGNADIHGIRAEELVNAPTFAALVDAIEPLLDGAVFVAHGASWDVAFVEAELARAGRPRKVGPYLDTLNLSRRAFGLQRHSLDALREHFGLDRTRAHRADADVAALREIWRRCVETLEPTTPRDLWQVRVAERRAREQIIAECNEAIASGQPVTVLYRPRARRAEPMQMVLVELVTGLDPPRVIGYQLPGRGRRELRADRILRIEPC